VGLGTSERVKQGRQHSTRIVRCAHSTDPLGVGRARSDRPVGGANRGDRRGELAVSELAAVVGRVRVLCPDQILQLQEGPETLNGKRLEFRQDSLLGRDSTRSQH
jgi:hypothetical protein